MIKKLKCHCGEVEAEVKIPETGVEKFMRCNCSLCKRKGYIIGVIGENDFKLIKGEKILKLYQYYTKVAKHYFCSICGIHTHNRPRINPKIYGINIACIDDIDTFALKDVPVNNGENHPLDQKNKMLQPDDLGETIAFLSQMPKHVCINEITISPTWHRRYIAGLGIEKL